MLSSYFTPCTRPVKLRNSLRWLRRTKPVCLLLHKVLGSIKPIQSCRNQWNYHSTTSGWSPSRLSLQEFVDWRSHLCRKKMYSHAYHNVDDTVQFLQDCILKDILKFASNCTSLATHWMKQNLPSQLASGLILWGVGWSPPWHPLWTCLRLSYACDQLNGYSWSKVNVLQCAWVQIHHTGSGPLWEEHAHVVYFDFSIADFWKGDWLGLFKS